MSSQPQFHVELTQNVIHPEQGIAFCHDASLGAESLFIGSVRHEHHKQSVTYIDYEIDDQMAEASMLHICQEAQEKFDTRKHYVVHRTHKVPAGEMSILIVVSSRHREASLNACRYILENLKHRAPIWKHEYYANGQDSWVLSHTMETAPHTSPTTVDSPSSNHS